MIFHRPRTVSQKILFAMVTMVLALTALLIVYYTMHNRSTLERYQSTSGISLTQGLAESARLGVVAREPLFLDSAFSTAMANPQVLFIAAYDSEGSLIDARSRISVNLDLTDESYVLARDSSAPFQGARIGSGAAASDDFFSPLFAEGTELLDEEMLFTRAEGEDATAQPYVGSVRLGLSRAQIVRAERSALLASVAIGSSALAAAILASLVMVRRIVRPLKQLEQGTRRIRDGDLSANVEVSQDDELGAVAGAFNAMAVSLRETTVSKGFMESIVGAMNEAMVVLDRDKNISAANEAAQRLLGYSAEELIGRPVDDLFAEPAGRPLDGSAWLSLPESPISGANAVYRSKDGRKIDVSISAAAMKGSGETRGGAVIVARDMREINAMIAKLSSHASELEHYQSVLMSMLDDNERGHAETEAERIKLSAAVRSMTDGLVMFDAAGRLALINPSAIGLLEAGSGEIRAEQIRTALGGRFDDLITGGPASEEGRTVHEIILGTHRRRVIMTEGVALRQENRLLGSMLVMRDISRQRELDEAKYELISNVSHELRTPLAIISNVVSNALVGVSGEIGDKLKKNLETCDTNTKRLAHIIDKLLHAASVEKGETKLERKIIDMREILSEAAHAFEKEADSKGLALSLKTPDEPMRALADPGALRNIIESLVSNAIRFTDKGSIILEAKVRGDRAELSVTDSGIGIPLEDQASIFHGFRQVGRTYGPGEKGLGLSLPIARTIIERHGGSISVTSIPGKGSRFTVLLPLASEDETTMPDQGE